MISEINVNNHEIIDSDQDSFTAKVELSCFELNLNKDLVVLIKAPWSNPRSHLIEIVRVSDSCSDKDLDFETKENFKKAIAAYISSKIK